MAFTNATGPFKRIVRAIASLFIAFALIGMKSSQVKAQTFAEWFKQSATQRKYLLQQIETLQVYSSYLRKGYAVAQGGLGSISGSLTSEFKLHGHYYAGLKNVSPAVAGDENVKEIVRWQNDILRLSGGWEKIEGLSGNESQYLSSVRDALLTDCMQLIATLENVVSDGKLEMSDADRLTLIRKLHTQMQENYRFAAAFTRRAKTYAMQRRQEENNVFILKKIYGSD